MTAIEPDFAGAEARLQRRLRLAGVAAILAAALGSMWSASSLAADPVGDDDCVLELATAAGFSSGCSEAPSAGTSR